MVCNRIRDDGKRLATGCIRSINRYFICDDDEKATAGDYITFYSVPIIACVALISLLFI